MARGSNQVTLTFAGDSEKLEKAFDNVGDSARQMDGDVDKASRNAGDSFDRFGESADQLDTQAMGFRDTMTGVEDSMKGVGDIAKGNLFEGFLTLGMGVGDLASGFVNLLVPSLKRGVTWLKNTTVAQKALNLAMRLNPIGIIITLLAAAAAGLVLAYKKSETFRNIVRGAFDVVRRGAELAWKVIEHTPLGMLIKNFGKVKDAASGVASGIKDAFTTAFEHVKSFWNSTAGGFGFDIPGWVPKIGGQSWRIPKMHTGGIVPGAPGQESMAILQAGEKVTPANQAGSQRTVIELRSGGSALDDLLVEVLAKAIRVRGGDVQLVLGSA